MSDFDRLVAFIDGLDVKLGVELNEETAIFESGLFDSLALMNLALWIEGEIGQPLDPSQLDLLVEWNTIGNILSFIDKHRVPNGS